MTVEGQSTAGVVLQGPGTNANVVGLAFGGGGGARSLTVRGFTYGFFVSAGAVTLENTAAEGNGAGLGAGGGTTKANGAEFKGGTRFGIYVSGTAALELSGGSVHDNPEHGILIGDGASKVTAKDLAVFGNSTGLTALGQPEVQLERAQFHDNRGHGLSVGGQSRLSVAQSAVYGNGQIGLSFGGRSLVVRGSVIRDNRSLGLQVVGSPEDVDLGTFTEPGNNELSGNDAGGVQISDERAGRTTLGDPETFTLSGTRMNGGAPAGGVYPGDGRWPHRTAPYFVISGVNNFIRVY